jgi:FkbH-like protein
MSSRPLRGLVISDFTADNLISALGHNAEGPRLDLEAAPFGAVVPTLATARETWPADLDFAVVWTQPEAAVPSFGRVLRFEDVPDAVLLQEVDAYADLLLGAAERVRFMLVPSWVRRSSARGLGLLDLGHRRGLARTIDVANARLRDRLQGSASIFLLDSRPWLQEAGPAAHDPRLWFMAKVPFGPKVFHAAAGDLKAAICALTGRARKLIIVDLDDTLWGGILGEFGWEALRLGGHDPVGEAYAEFQRALKAMTHRGVILAIASKNDEETALGAIRDHPEMVLRIGDFAGWRINWDDKARNIADLVASLNLGLDAAVFLDDNPAERGRVREALPDVLVPDWPASPLLYASALETLSCFDTAQISEEDSTRASMYSAERDRAALRDPLGPIDAWLETLGIRISVETFNKLNEGRAAQLLNKTNQMNLATRRLTTDELADWAHTDSNVFWTFRMADRFGDYGLTGLLGVTLQPDRKLRIVDWVLSCRVMGRRMEETMLHVAANYGRQCGASELVATLVPTERNGPCLEFWKTRSGFTESDTPYEFLFDLATPYPAPDAVTLVTEVEAG